MRHRPHHSARLWLTLAAAGVISTAALAQTPPQQMRPGMQGMPGAPGGQAAAAIVPVALPPAPQILHIHSIFYTPDEIKRIHFAISAYIKRTTGHEQDMALDEINFLKQLTGLKGAKTGTGALIGGTPESTDGKPKMVTIYPQFYLSSLAYHTGDDWSLWLNNEKFTQSAPKTGDMRVVSVSPDKATFEWKPVDMELVNAVWDKTPSDDAEVDKLHGTVSFSLRMNQTFASYSMRVAEGKMQPMAVPTAQLKQQEEKSTPLLPGGGFPDEGDGKSAAAAAMLPPKADENTGFNGLLNAYKGVSNNRTNPP